MKISIARLKEIIMEEVARAARTEGYGSYRLAGASSRELALTGDQLGALVDAGVDPRETAGLNQGNLQPEHIEILQAAGIEIVDDE